MNYSLKDYKLPFLIDLTDQDDSPDLLISNSPSFFDFSTTYSTNPLFSKPPSSHHFSTLLLDLNHPFIDSSSHLHYQRLQFFVSLNSNKNISTTFNPPQPSPSPLLFRVFPDHFFCDRSSLLLLSSNLHHLKDSDDPADDNEDDDDCASDDEVLQHQNERC